MSEPAEVFILDMTLRDGRAFTTSVSSRESIRPARARAKARTVRVSHWIQDGWGHSVEDRDGWRLKQRWTL